MTPLGLSTYRWNNNIKSMFILAAFPCLLVGLVALFFWIIAQLNTTPDGLVNPAFASGFGFSIMHPPQSVTDFTLATTQTIAPIMLGVAALWILIGTLFNDGLIRMATSAEPVNRAQYPEAYNLLENLCISRGMTMPKFYIIDTPVKNAYASGISKGSFAVTVTRGILESLNKDELEAVLAHELSHIMNRDVRLLVVTVLFSGMLSFMAEMAFRSIRHMNFSGGNNRRGNGVILMILIAAILFFVGYLISTLFRLALSRRREFLADAGAVELTKNPQAMITALQKISGNSDLPSVPSGVQAMMIDNPPGFLSLFDTHPPIEARIAVLRRLAGNPPEHGESIIPRVG